VTIAGVAGAALLLPAISLVGTLLAPSQPVPAATRVPPHLADALWARANGGRATQLQPLNPFTIGRTATCHLFAEFDAPERRETEHDQCMKLLPAVQAVGYLSTVHMRSEGVWQDPRVPFVQIATMNRITSTWTKAQLLDTLAARGGFGAGFIGAEAASTGYFGRSVDHLNVAQAAMIAAFIGDERVDPWCDPAAAANLRRGVLERMLADGVIDDAAYQSANVTELGLATPPATHKPCER
jgi:Transglycosylase